MGRDMGNSKPHLQFVMQYNWEDAKAAAKAAVAAAWEGGATRLAMGCKNGIYRSPACASLAAIALRCLGYTVHVRHVALAARGRAWGGEYADVLADLTTDMPDDDIKKFLPAGLLEKIPEVMKGQMMELVVFFFGIGNVLIKNMRL